MKRLKVMGGRMMSFWMVIILVFFTGIIDSNAQSTEDNDQQDGSFNDISKESFKSDFEESNSQKSVDYSRESNGADRKENFNIFGNDNANTIYKFEENTEGNSRQNSNNGGFNISGGGGQTSSSQNVNPNNSNSPTIANPFKQSQTGVKTPRNIDAVPDNGDEPNDVPLDSGIVILGLAAVVLGLKISSKDIRYLV